MRSRGWPWGKAAAHQTAGPTADDSIDQTSDDDPEGAWSELYAIEADVAVALESVGSVSGFKTLTTRLERWLKKRLTVEGLLRQSPWQTHSAFPSLFRLRLGLRKLGWTSRCESGFQDVVAACYRTSSNGGWIGEAKQASKEFKALLLQHALTKEGREWADVHRWLLGGTRPAKRTRAPEPSIQSDDAAIAVLRRDWTKKSTIAACDFPSDAFRLLWQILGTPVVDGEWTTTVRVDGETLRPAGPWEAVCWHVDRDGDYLELRQPYGSETTLERQLFLARPAAFFLMADTLKVETPAQLHLRWSLPAPTPFTASPTATRAQDVSVSDFELRLLPIGLPADPKTPAGGKLALGKTATFERGMRTRRLHLPLAWTWNPRTLPKASNWRELTVTNDRRVVGAEEAVAFRVSLGDHQVVYFRAQDQSKRFAFLGHQTLSECVIGRLDSVGDFEQWLIVE